MTTKPCEWCGFPLHLAPADGWKTLHQQCFRASRAAADRRLMQDADLDKALDKARDKAADLEADNAYLKWRVKDLESQVDVLTIENTKRTMELLQAKRGAGTDPADFRACCAVVKPAG